MQTQTAVRLVAALFLVSPCVALADNGGHGSFGGHETFVGFYSGALTGFEPAGPPRCPSSHPWLITVEGDAYTSAGHLTFTQSHCEDDNHTSFRRGEQTGTTDTGDVLYGRYQGQIMWIDSNLPMVIVDGKYQNMGGTGIFKSAYGSGTSVGVVDASKGTAQTTVDGRL